MREFIYYSNKGRTSGNFTDLMKAGRMDIVCHVVINSFFLSQKMREDVKLHLLLNGPPDPPKHIEIKTETRKGIPETGKQAGSIDISKKDIGGLIQRILYKYKKGKKIEPYKGIFVEKKSLAKLIDELNGRNVYLLDKKGEDISKMKIEDNPVFIIGDHEGIPKKIKKYILKNKDVKPISIGPQVYFASHVVVILNNILDRNEI
jgi:tRNA pseudouridine-54 N-methylase